MSARREGSRRVDQGEVWDDVAHKHQERSVGASPTGAMRDAFDISRGEIAEILNVFKTPEPGQTGVIACLSGRCVALDSFDRPETLSKLWARLLRGYAMDALGSAPVSMQDGAVQRFLDDAASGETTSHEGIGLGMDVMLTMPTLVGHALTWEGGVVHLALFTRGENPTERSTHQRTIESPQRRRRYIR